MTISQLGTYNISALTVPGVYVQIVPPAFRLNGVPSSIFGAVGTTTWGPMNQPQIIGDYAEFASVFGQMQARPYDLGTAAWVAFQQGPAAAGKFVRVTDGTDTAASIVVQTNCITLTGKYTGSRGNNIQVAIGVGSAVGSYRARVIMPGETPEVYDNIFKGVKSVPVSAAGTGYTSAPAVTFTAPQIAGGRRARGHTTLTSDGVGAVVIDDPGSGYTAAPTATLSGGGGSGATLGTVVISVWPAMADAINNGQSGLRGPSRFVVASAGAGTTTPSETLYSLTGGTDGAAGITSAIMLGTDAIPRTGMYALRGQDVSCAMLVDLVDTNTWATQQAFGVSEGIAMCVMGPSGESISAAVTAKTNAAIDTYAIKVLLGDYVYMFDPVNNLPRRLVSPQAYWIGRRANLSPEHSSLNKRVEGVIATQRTETGMPYTDADVTELQRLSIDVLTAPAPGGNYFAYRTGRNASSDPGTRGENYTTMTNYLAKTLNAGMGRYIGALQSRRVDDKTRRDIKATLDSFLSILANTQPYPMIDEFDVVVNKSNNSNETIALGYAFAYVRVVYMSIVEFLVVNLEGGQTVNITRQNQAPF